MNEMLKELSNVRELCSATKANSRQSSLPTIVNKLFWFYGLEQRIKLPVEKFNYLYPNLLQSTDLGYQLRDSYKITLDEIEKYFSFDSDRI